MAHSRPYASRPSPQDIARPRNSFIFFRSAFKLNPTLFQTDRKSFPDQNSLSCAAAAVWRSLDDDGKAPYRKMALEEKERYQRDYPNYRYGATGAVRKARAKKQKRRPTRHTPPPPPPMPLHLKTEDSDDDNDVKMEEDAPTSPAVSSDGYSTPPPRTPSPNPTDASSPVLTSPPQTPSVGPSSQLFAFTSTDASLVDRKLFDSEITLPVPHDDGFADYRPMIPEPLDIEWQWPAQNEVKSEWDTFEDMFFSSPLSGELFPSRSPTAECKSPLRFFNEDP
ncbi:hypothetical protein CYLTODRAFT_493331 [Cylindrobasidium torrendii FP15055 ss-10]|uniref:HMG box domain-containing protein n=1 Tax=Cylindrobasidium torrendii FP15055 ss-10 TaxID=1314674 RepID=A0A0D7B3Q3_9AGAR|nr:hypothetical protein CYLTODRAFT_493331 [Cylindrobasidium torrendii FP15055 ss-10]